MSERTPLEPLIDLLIAAAQGDEDVVEVRFDPRAFDGGLAIHPRQDKP